MTAPTGWWCPNCGHTVNAVVGTQPHPAKAEVRALADQTCSSCGGTGDRFDRDTNDWVTPRENCPDCTPVGVPVGGNTPPLTAKQWTVDGSGALISPGGTSFARSDVPVGDDTPAPTAGRWVVDDDTIWFEVGPGESLEPWEALPGTVTGQQAQRHFDAAYDALVALIRRAGATPDLTAQQQAVIDSAVAWWKTPKGLAQVGPYYVFDAAVAALVRDTPEQAHDG